MIHIAELSEIITNKFNVTSRNNLFSDKSNFLLNGYVHLHTINSENSENTI